MLSLMGGLWVMSGSAPLAAQTAGRSFSPSTVAPGGQVTVTIEAVGYGSFGGITETLPAGFTLESIDAGANGGVALADAADGRKMVRFTLLAAPQTVSYVVNASSAVGPHTFQGTLVDDDQAREDVGGTASITVSTDTTPDPTPVATATATAEPEESDPPSLADSSIIVAVNGDAAISGPLAMITVKDQGSAAAVPPNNGAAERDSTGCWLYQSGNLARAHVHPCRVHRTVASICGSWDSRRGLCHSSREWR